MPQLGDMSGERRERVARVQARMRGQDLDALLVSDPANIFYLSGYNAWSFYTPQVLFVPADGAPLIVMREMDANGAHRTADLSGDAVLGYPETLVHRPDAHPFDWIAAELRDRGFVTPGTRRIGYEGDAHFFPVRGFLALTRAWPHVDFVESRELVNWVRLVKSDTEIELMRRAGAVASHAMLAGIAAIEAGAPQHELAAVIQAAQARGVPGAGGDYPAIVPMFPTGAGADTPHLTWTSAPLVAGEAVAIELAGVHQRYHAPLARTVTLGPASADLDRVAGVTVDGLHAALDAIRPGVTPADVVGAWDWVLAANGLEKRSRLGYSIGVGYPPDWGERTVSLRADDHTELRENMTFHVIAGMWMTGYGFETSESVRVTASGVELLTDVPRELIVRSGR
ncbi:M24 family metallopeptidase [Leucobacter sp. M11]|uniref:M24 family metallopeptidase n=1 Tax=Leucobacter sp. M11 TaxID=2993565 RepID=UPI002D7ECC71|nr:M24 family metallopeptidase [Leucobacter sp. M11]MEB4614845.1 M24 family metallopeptidase [Leucobacter sp. M11]